MRPVLLAAAALVAGAVPATTAQAAWGPVLRPAASAEAQQTSVAVNARGDVGVAWLQEQRRFATVRAAVKRGGAPLRVRTLLHERDSAVAGLTAALDRRGELTVVWVERGSTRGLLHGHITVRAAFRTPSGRWSSVRSVTRISPFFYAQPRLAVAPDGTVVLAVNAGNRTAKGMAAAWRRPGRPFGTIRPAGAQLQEPSLAFDASGRAHLAGTARCDDEQRSTGVLRTATLRTRRFGADRVVARPPANHVRLVLTGRGAGVATWLRTGCSTTEDLTGPVRAALVRNGRAQAPSIVEDVLGTEPFLATGPGGSADAAWTAYAPDAPGGAVHTARIAPDGSIATPGVPADGWVARAGDAAGDELVAAQRPANHGPPTALGARRAGVSEVVPAPTAVDGWPVFAAAPTGRALAVAVPARAFVRVAVWRP